MKIIGIDPGKSGGICRLDTSTSMTSLRTGPRIESLDLCPIVKVKNKKEYDINGMRALLEGANEVWIEKVHSMPVEFKYRGKVRKQGGASIFSFGKGYGIWLGLIAGLWIRVNEVAPQTWKKFWLKDMSKDKGSAILRVQQLFPDVNLLPTERSRKLSDAFADAILIAMYGMQFKH